MKATTRTYDFVITGKATDEVKLGLKEMASLIFMEISNHMIKYEMYHAEKLRKPVSLHEKMLAFFVLSFSFRHKKDSSFLKS